MMPPLSCPRNTDYIFPVHHRSTCVHRFPGNTPYNSPFQQAYVRHRQIFFVPRNGTVRQKRTYYDRQNADIEQAKVFLLRWQKQLTKKLNKEDKILAFKSRDLRKKEIEELRKNKVKVNGFGYRGKLLADLLEEDLMEAAA